MAAIEIFTYPGCHRKKSDPGKHPDMTEIMMVKLKSNVSAQRKMFLHFERLFVDQQITID